MPWIVCEWFLVRMISSLHYWYWILCYQIQSVFTLCLELRLQAMYQGCIWISLSVSDALQAKCAGKTPEDYEKAGNDLGVAFSFNLRAPEFSVVLSVYSVYNLLTQLNISGCSLEKLWENFGSMWCAGLSRLHRLCCESPERSSTRYCSSFP